MIFWRCSPLLISPETLSERFADMLTSIIVTMCFIKLLQTKVEFGDIKTHDAAKSVLEKHTACADITARQQG